MSGSKYLISRNVFLLELYMLSITIYIQDMHAKYSVKTMMNY